MKLSSVINKRLIFLDLKASGMEEAIREMVHRFFEEMGIEDLYKKEFIDAVVAREQQAITAFGKEVAFPHARLDNFNDFAIIIGRSTKGIDCNALDKKPVKLFFMILTAKTKNAQLLHALAALSQLVENGENRSRLMTASSADDVHRYIESTGIEFRKSIAAENIMIEDPITVTLDMTMKEASDVLFNNDITGVPVVDGKKLVGELTEKELIKMGLPQSMSFLNSVSFIKDFEPFEKYFKEEDKVKVRDIVDKEIVTVSPKASIVEVAFLFVQKNRRRLYVVDEKKNLQGIIMRHHLLMKVLHP